jgi:hypothetical protein
MRLLPTLRFAFAALLLASVLPAQDPATNPVDTSAPPSSRLRVFLDCRSDGCDRDFLIEEVPFMALTRDRADSEVHVLITGMETGAGGTQLTFEFIGLGRFVAKVDTLVTSIPPNTTSDARRREVARILKLGLVPYAVRTASLADLEVSLRERDDDRVSGVVGLRDPWNFWRFDIDLNGDIGAESSERDYEIEASFSADRVTEQIKSGFGINWEYSGRWVRLSEDSTRTSALREADFEAYHIKSLGDHWSAGGSVGLALDEFRNQKLRGELNLAVEYSFLPYRLATQKQLVLIGLVGLRHYQYLEETLYQETSETRPSANLVLSGESQRPWGSADASLSYFQFLHDRSKYSVSLDASANIRVTRGLSINFSAFGSKINDQLYIPLDDIDPDDILTEQRALATAYRFGGSVGLSFTFGSIYNTIVNPRFERID